MAVSDGQGRSSSAKPKRWLLNIMLSPHETDPRPPVLLEDFFAFHKDDTDSFNSDTEVTDYLKSSQRWKNHVHDLQHSNDGWSTRGVAF